MTNVTSRSSAPTPTWYDILGVDRDAEETQIRQAWREATDRFGPGAGGSQFRMYNQAADVLLDPERRRQYDESLHATQVPEPADVGAAEVADPPRHARGEAETTTVAPAMPVERERSHPRRATKVPGELEKPTRAKKTARTRKPQPVEKTNRTRRPATTALVILTVLLALVTALAIAGLVYLFNRQHDRALVADARSQAPASAERALPAVLSYDYRRLPADRKRAEGFLSPAYAKQYDKTFRLLENDASGNPGAAVQTKAVVKADVIGSGVVDAEADKARVLVFVDQTAQKAGQDPQIFQNRVAVTMVRSGNRWLVDDLKSY